MKCSSHPKRTFDTDLKKDKETALENRIRREDAQTFVQAGSWVLDFNDNTLHWSDGIFQIFEISSVDFGASYEAFLDLVHPDDRAMVDTAFTDSIKNHTTYAIEHRLLFSEERVKYVVEIGDTIYDDQGKPLRAIGTIQDITAFKKAEEALSQSEEKFRTVADFTYDWEYWIGPNGNYYYSSPLVSASPAITHRNSSKTPI